ncbi:MULTISPECIES: ABC transporter ATP-binding protein [Legionella]|uniref:ABC transporter ATP-binding protein n=1 Tax=Legionella TaxID=445 RepID=UPI000F8CFF37|nr:MULTISPECIES: ABC transporter ATP-binding protein [Legionella]MCP0914355.1 ABC transporter ATP-binding protein [Legionella sp. 27cVA30]RUR00292.1 ABC transporter ATP-binding protein [Legionella septentrionalis]RUR11851.1 ABC transporter ATP-binding protein [Legionella septentrionalis]RUR17538.1 ABC transporter ATP-binding protein [Legionella septentrionalis]
MNDTAQDYALYCKKLSKDFYIIDDNLNWRIVFCDPHKNLQAFHALADIDLLVPKGKFVGILGRNGAGKSTLLRILGGVYPPTTGIVKANGAISGLFEMGGMGNNRLTGRAYADRYLEIFGIGKSERQKLITNIQEFSELGEDFNKPVYTYSSGMSARLFFATATELQHEIYLVDELLSVGDEHFQAKCWKRLRERFSNGASGILVTHDWAAVLKLCEQSYILAKGQIVAHGSSENMVQQYLQLPVPTREYAEIIPQDSYLFASGRDCEIAFDILVKKPVSLAVSYSVDLFRAGYGWELILLNEDFVKIHPKPGMNSCRIKIKKLPLIAGDYYLNLFLKSLDATVDNLKIDTRSWTYGNGIKLQVTGAKDDAHAMTRLPWAVKIEKSHMM